MTREQRKGSRKYMKQEVERNGRRKKEEIRKERREEGKASLWPLSTLHQSHHDLDERVSSIQ
jgi:hypothetical protein